MPFLKNIEKRCAVCNHLYKYQHLQENNSFGMRDLDTRPPGMMRKMQHLSIQKCPNCGYVNNNISFLIEDFNQEELQKPLYQECLNDTSINFAIKKFKLYAILLEKRNNQKAGMAYLKAAWMADDAKNDKVARMLRSKAIKFLEKSLNEEENENIRLILVDLYRRVGLFEEALEYANFLLENFGMERYKRNILFYQIKLCNEEDVLDHTIPGNYNFLKPEEE